ncbi:hypothetical protein [Litchfieldella rifensis]|uniref:Uncharacterized protein n=1 Tax=Litchfieldella rifensis TaxID=762643 RepID=A0ABV7LUZ1_9GAMM
MADDKISARELVHDLLPKLQATEDLAHNTLGELVNQVESEEERNYRRNQQIEFELEITMIQMNFDHLLKRYAREVEEALTTSGRAGVTLKLDQHERFAVESAKQLYRRAQVLQI